METESVPSPSAPDRDQPILSIDRLSKSFGALKAVDELSLTVHPGEVCALLGPNGAGKSTTVRCLVGLETPDSGSIEIAGADAKADPRAARQRTGYVPELARLHEALTPTEYLALRGRLFGLSEERIESRTEQLLQQFDLTERRDSALSDLSKGNAQRIAIAASLLPGPRLWILDEPMSGLDVETAMLVQELVRRFADAGGAVLYCSHLLEVVEAVADQVAVLSEGKLVGQGTLEELRRGPSDSDSSTERLGEVFRRLTRSSDPAARAASILDAVQDPS
ncbi:MAG: ABC transporter ATP-binding protein [Planctomycetota bacterium]